MDTSQAQVTFPRRKTPFIVEICPIGFPTTPKVNVCRLGWKSFFVNCSREGAVALYLKGGMESD